MQKSNNEFKEVQSFRQWWLWIILFSSSGINWYIFIKQIIFGISVGNKPAPDWVVVFLFIIIGVGLPTIFLFTKLIIIVKEKTLAYRFFPFHLRFHEIDINTINKFEKVTYKPIRDYGGWGIRNGMMGKAYNISGNQGVRIITMMGDKILFGSLRANELYNSLKRNHPNTTG
jgi:hypothetical protein